MPHSHKETRMGTHPGGLSPADQQSIDRILAWDRSGRREDSICLYEGTPDLNASITASELLSEIDRSELDSMQQLLVRALEQEAASPPVKNEQEIASAKDTYEVFRQYKSTPNFNNLANHLHNFRFGNSSSRGYEERFTGAVFADIARCIYSASNRDGVLISEGATFKLFSDLTGEEPIEHPYGVRALAHITVPDGMVIGVSNNKPLLLKFVEYSITSRMDKFTRQFEAYQEAFRRIKFESPTSISPSFGVDFVVPKKDARRRYPALKGEIGANYHYLDQIDPKGFGYEITDILLG